MPDDNRRTLGGMIDYIENFYNPQGRHSFPNSLRSPLESAKQFAHLNHFGRQPRANVVIQTVAIRRTMCYTFLMTRTIAQRELRNDNARVIDEVVAGESFVVTRNGVPVAELLPLRALRRTVVPKSSIANFIGAGPGIDAKLFRADLDNLINQDL
jgi:prevent-host-death family protein